MISPLSVTNRYTIQPTLIGKHKKTMEWISAAVLWQNEMAFFQKILDKVAVKFSSEKDKKTVSHFQSIITYYNSELLNYVTTKLRLHERKLADMLEVRDETRTEYFHEHDTLMGELESVNAQMSEYKTEFFRFIEKVM
jgi:hypothetical protein